MAVKNFCYCIGGVGSKISEVAGHLCAMNMVGNQDITFIVVDKDDDCGGTVKAKKLLQIVTALADVERHPETALVRSGGEDKEFCKSKLDTNSWNFSNAMSELTASSNDASLKNTIIAGHDNQDFINADEILLDAFYSKKEQNKDTEGGFYGHPSIGALIFKYMVKKSNWVSADNKDIKKDDIAYPIKEHLKNSTDNVAKVFIFGSIFGGTGASIFSNLAQYIRTSLSDTDKERVFISGALMLPYFTFPAKDGGMIDPTDFYSKSIVALTQYGNDQNLLRNKNDSPASFDSIYVCGQSPLHCIAEKYSDSGKDQKNHFNLVDLLAAQAMTEFFNAEIHEKDFKNYERGLYEYRFTTNNVETLKLFGISSVERQLKAMTAFCTYFITKLYASVKYDDPTASDIFKNLYTKDELPKKKLFGKPEPSYFDKNKTKVDKIMDSVFAYCCSFVNFMCDIANNGFDWSLKNTSYANNYDLFNPEYFMRLNEIIVGFKGDVDNQKNAIRICNQMNNSNAEYVRKVNGITCGEIQKQLDDLFAQKPQMYGEKNNQTEVTQRIGDYIHSAFAVCFNNVKEEEK